MSVPAFRDVYEKVTGDGDSMPGVTLYGRSTGLDLLLRPRLLIGVGRVNSKRLHGKYLMFLDIINEFERVQAMINWRTVKDASSITKPQFRLFTQLIERGDHICEHRALVDLRR